MFSSRRAGILATREGHSPRESTERVMHMQLCASAVLARCPGALPVHVGEFFMKP